MMPKPITTKRLTVQIMASRAPPIEVLFGFLITYQLITMLSFSYWELIDHSVLMYLEWTVIGCKVHIPYRSVQFYEA